MRAAMPFQNGIIDNFMVYQDRLETNVLQACSYLRTQKIKNGFL